jgi:hypothetical protein
MYGFKMKLNLVLALFALIMEENIHLMNLKATGIKHQTIVPYNPQHNGVVERMNKTLLNMVRSMMFFKNVKLMFWVDAVLCAVYVKNMCPSHALKNKTSYEMWYGSTFLGVVHLRVFGSTCYALIPKEKRSKFLFSTKGTLGFYHKTLISNLQGINPNPRLPRCSKILQEDQETLATPREREIKYK